MKYKNYKRQVEFIPSGGNMTRWALILMLCVAVPGLCFAAGNGSTYGSTVKADPVQPGNYRTYDSRGNWTGTIKPDPVVPGQFRIEDKDGKPAGFIKPDPLVPGEYRSTPSPSPQK